MSPSASLLQIHISVLPFQPSSHPDELSGQCRLRRIQSRECCIDFGSGPHRPGIQPATSPSKSDSSAITIHQNPEENTTKPVSVNTFATTSTSVALADVESDSDTSSSATSPPLSYPFPPPGLSKASPPQEMITPDYKSSSCTPREPELKSDSLFTFPSTANHCPSDPDGSVWSAFRMESFIGNYCHTNSNNKSLTPSPSFHSDNENDTETALNVLPSIIAPRTGLHALSPLHRTRFKDPTGADETAFNLHTTLLARSSQHPLSSFPYPNPSREGLSPINPFMAHRQRQKAFMSSWNHIRQTNRFTPAMPSFFNPIRNEAPGCAWTFLRDPACGGKVNERLSPKKGRDSIFEKALVKLPLTRCRSTCDRIRRDQQNLFGWGIHAWIAPSKHCQYCVNDELLKGVLAYRAFEFEKFEEEMRQTREQERSVLFMRPSEPEDAVDSDAVLLSFPYRTSSNEDRIQTVPTDPWINYNDLDFTARVHHNCSHSSCDSKTPQSNLDPKDVSGWSKELEKRLLASPIIRDMDDFDLEDEDMEGFDDEDLDGFYDSDEEEEEGYSSSGSSSPTSDGCECEHESGCGCPRIVDTEVKPGDVSETNIEDPKDPDENVKITQDHQSTAICEKILMSFWEEEENELDGVDVDHVVWLEMMDAGLKEEEMWVVDELRVMEVQVHA